MLFQKLDRLTGIATLIVAMLFLLAMPGSDPAWGLRLPDAGAVPLAPHSTPPTTVTVDDEGYTIWSIDWSSETWCVPVSTLRYPIDLGTQDPTALEDTSLILTFSEGLYSPDVQDPSWTVALNGSPPGDWQTVGAISGPATHEKIWNTAVIPIDPTLVIDGENNVWLQQHDVCPQSPGCETCACTCIELGRVALRAAVEFKVKHVSPTPDAENVVIDQRSNSEIRAKFTTLPDPKTVNPRTFQVYYMDDNLNEVYVAGSVAPVSDTEFAFKPQQLLRDGIQYEARVWGQEEAEAEGRDEWVTDRGGNPLEVGRIWSFWTLPELQVKLVPVQVLEGATLIANKPTVLKTFVRWDHKPDVFAMHQVNEIEVYDITLAWTALNGTHQGQVHWREDDYGWRPARDSETARRRREYREVTFSDDSYDKFEKLAARDSVNYFGFLPLDTGGYVVSAQVKVQDNRGNMQTFLALATPNVVASRRFGLHVRAVGVGADYGKTGTVDLSDSVKDSVDAVKAIFPVPSVTRPPAASAMSYYTPTTTLWIFDWRVSPAWSFPKKYIIQELSVLCERTTGCDAMLGFVPQDWIVDIGLSLPESAPRGVLAQADTTGFYRFIAAHEIGHLFGFEHDTLHGSEGYWVSRRQDRRYSVAQLPPQTERTLNIIYNFMTIDPVESPPPERLWIDDVPYNLLLSRITGSGGAMTVSGAATADPLLLAAGGIVEATGEVQLLPWYQLDPGDWTAPTPGPYKLVFLDALGQEIVGYSHPFTVTTSLTSTEPALFTLKAPYPAATARIQIIKTAGGGDTLLAEMTPSASAPSLTIDPPGSSTWHGPQTLTWQSDEGVDRYFAVDVSTDNGATWEALAVNLTARSYTLETVGLPNTTQAQVRVSASDGLRTTTATVGPFTIDNPPLVAFVSPSPGATSVGIAEGVIVGFRDAMDAATIHGGLTVSGGPFGAVTGTLVYDSIDREATFIPRVPLAYTTTYTATISTGVKDSTGDALPAAKSWSFTTEEDIFAPRPSAFSPGAGALNAALNTQVVVAWNQALNASTVNTGTFTLAAANGSAVSGSVAYDAGSRMATFSPLTNLAPNTIYIATLKAGVQDTDGNATSGDFRWAFSTGSDTVTTLAFTGAYADYGVDDNGDGLFEQLVIQVGVQVTTTGTYGLKGVLVDTDDAEIAWEIISVTLQPGVSFVELAFDGTKIGGHGVDGPYTLTGLTLFKAQGPDATRLGAAVWAMEAYQTFAYAASQFPAPLRFMGLPDLLVKPGGTLNPAFNVHGYAEHIVQSSDQLSYTLLANTDLRAGVTLGADGNVKVNPESGWLGSIEVTIQARYGADVAQDTFRVTVGWASELYLPLVLRDYDSSSTQPARSNWRIAFSDDFEESFSWQTFSIISRPPGGWYYWARRDCAASSGGYSMWPFGGGETGEITPCGAHYPDTLDSTMRYRPSINLKYTSQAEFRIKIWTDLAPGDEICAMVTIDEMPTEGYPWQVQFYGVCRSGQTNGWEDLTLDLSDVPTLGNLLGREEVWVAVKFIADESGTRPIGAYVDDAELRVCPQGLTCQP